MEMLFEALKSLIEVYGGSQGWLVTVVAWVGTARLVFKPIMTAIESIVATTPSTDDDKKLEEIKASTAYFWIVFLIDWFASIKLPKAKK